MSTKSCQCSDASAKSHAAGLGAVEDPGGLGLCSTMRLTRSGMACGVRHREMAGPVHANEVEAVGARRIGHGFHVGQPVVEPGLRRAPRKSPAADDPIARRNATP